jgi:hypothetical protein
MIAVWISVLASRVEGQAAPAPCRAVVVEPASEELGLRILGQSRDVACQLELVPAAEGAGCAQLAEQHGALAVMVVREPAATGSYELVVCDAVGDTEQVRSVTVERSDALGASAAYEAVALVVRSALVDLVAIHEARRLEREARERQASEAHAAEARRIEREEQAAQRAREAEARAVDEREGDEPDDSASEPRSWWFALGGEGVIPTQRMLAPAVVLRAVTELGVMRVGLGLSLGLATDAPGDEDEPRLSIARHSALALAFLPIEVSPRWALELGVFAGATAIARSTHSDISGVQPTGDATHWSVVLGPELGCAFNVTEWLGMRGHVALDVVPSAPTYAYRDVTSTGSPAGETQRGGAMPVQPRFGITLFAEL